MYPFIHQRPFHACTCHVLTCTHPLTSCHSCIQPANHSSMCPSLLLISVPLHPSGHPWSIHPSTRVHSCTDLPFHACIHAFINIHACNYLFILPVSIHPPIHSHIHYLIDIIQVLVHPPEHHALTTSIYYPSFSHVCIHPSSDIHSCIHQPFIHPSVDLYFRSSHPFIFPSCHTHQKSIFPPINPPVYPSLISCSSHPVLYPYPFLHPASHPALSILPRISINLTSHPKLFI